MFVSYHILLYFYYMFDGKSGHLQSCLWGKEKPQINAAAKKPTVVCRKTGAKDQINSLSLFSAEHFFFHFD